MTVVWKDDLTFKFELVTASEYFNGKYVVLSLKYDWSYCVANHESIPKARSFLYDYEVNARHFNGIVN